MKGLVLTYIISALATVGALRFPLVGLSVYIGFAVARPQFLFGWAGDISGVSFYLGIAVLIGWAFKGFGSWKFGRGRGTVYALLFFTLWFMISSLFALSQAPAWASLINLSKFILPFLVGVTLIESEAQWKPLLWTIVGCQGYVGFEMNLHYLFKNYNAAADGFGGMDNNCFGVSLITVLGPAVALMMVSKSWKGRLIAAACALLILHSTMLTFSRGAMVGLLGIAGVAFVMMPKRPKYFVPMILGVVIFLQLMGPQLAERYGSAFAAEGGEREASAQSRIDLWRDCVTVINEYPIFGVGPGNWRVIASQYGWPEGKSAHSVWMETAAELGLPGTALLLLFFGTALIKLWPLARARLTDDNRNEVALAIGVVLAIVGFAVGGQFVSVPGLEVPYYITMLGASLLKHQKTATAAPVEATVPAAPRFPPVMPARRQLPARPQPQPVKRVTSPGPGR